MRRVPPDLRIQPDERADDGACIVCKRRHIHTDNCLMLDLRPKPEYCVCGHAQAVHRDGERGCLGGTGFCTCPQFLQRPRT
jgi:hypothetical protein